MWTGVSTEIRMIVPSRKIMIWRVDGGQAREPQGKVETKGRVFRIGLISKNHHRVVLLGR